MVRNKLHWDANNAVGLPKQRNSYQSSPTFLCFGSPTASFASQCNLFRTMWPDPAKGLLNTMMVRTANENAACLRRICKRSDQPKIVRLVNNDARPILRESLTEQRHDRVQTESQIATVDSCFNLVGSLQHGVASCEVLSWSTDIHKPTIRRWWSPLMKLKSKSLPIGQCHMLNAWQGTIGKIQNIVSLPR